MSVAIDTGPDVAPRPERAPREVIYRHAFLVRLTHWLNALTIFIMIGSGLNIFNAHPHLYWGQKGSELDRPFLSIGAVDGAAGPRGITTIGPVKLDTTRLLGVSTDHGQVLEKAWPSWLTIPSNQDLADARHWHFFFAWILVANGLVYLLWGLVSRHLKRDLWPTWSDLRSIPRSVLDHIRLRHPTGGAAKRYNVLQRLAYLGLITLVILMVLTGLTMSPGFDAFAPWLLDLFGGRQSARSIHFFCASGIVAFIVIHLVEVVLAGPINEVTSMITGRYAVPQGRDRDVPPARSQPLVVTEPETAPCVRDQP
jgi:thiosulfate reductase cytochrome b subunit